jgi:adenylate kinase
MKKAYNNESDFKKQDEMRRTLIDLQNQIEKEVGAPITKKDKDIFF